MLPGVEQAIRVRRVLVREGFTPELLQESYGRVGRWGHSSVGDETAISLAPSSQPGERLLSHAPGFSAIRLSAPT